ncbi:DUF948 domain-containing protein [Paludifilum halophilum]|uniref:DUF948 domain-containing protein n=1 Tax=Paludifilum halophilum TaxID=1642702 RepID=UPI00146C6195|nr:DUF948 domain-containing protein [Paludifilum halophilum]
MNLIIEISAGVAAAAFVALVVALIVSLRKVNRTLDSVNTTLNEVQPQLEEVAEESKKTLGEAHVLLADLRAKSQQTDSLFETVEHVSNHIQELSSTITRTAAVQKERLGNVTALIGAGLDLFKKWRSDKNVDKKKRVRVK